MTPTQMGAALESDALITTLLKALRDCRTAATDGNMPPSARLEIIRDTATPVIVECEKAQGAAWRAFWATQDPSLDPEALDHAALTMVNAERTAPPLPARALARLRAKVAATFPGSPAGQLWRSIHAD